MKYQTSTGKTFEVVGIPRSGQHAIATWLMAQMPSPSLFINNSTCIRPDEVWFKHGRRNQGNVNGKPEVLGIGIEGNASAADVSENPSVFVIRDVKNHMASLIKHRTLQTNWPQFFKSWEAYALLATENPDKSYPYMVVPFSTWHTSADLRIKLYQHFEQIMGGFCTVYNDDARKDVMASGGGSSFDGQKFVGCGDKMKVLERYRIVELPPIPLKILELNEEVFGNIYD